MLRQIKSRDNLPKERADNKVKHVKIKCLTSISNYLANESEVYLNINTRV